MCHGLESGQDPSRDVFLPPGLSREIPICRSSAQEAEALSIWQYHELVIPEKISNNSDARLLIDFFQLKRPKFLDNSNMYFYNVDYDFNT